MAESRCTNCGSEVPEGFRFCGHCGAPQELADHGADSAGERRWATALFADLEGFTSASERLDPEEVRTLVDRGLRRLIAIVEQYGGWVNRVMGDGMLALFGAPQAHEDDPERAVRCALEMQECARQHADDFGRLRLRIGVHTGEIMFGTVGREVTAMGDVVNTASRLQTAAEPGCVFVGADTWRATNQVIAYKEIGALVVKGKREPVDAWQALHVEAKPGARPLSRSPLVGRDEELATLLHCFELTGRTRRPHLAALLGPAGIGKSKLARALVEVAEARGAVAVWGRSLPYGERAGYGGFGQLVKQLADVFETDDAITTRNKLAACGGDNLAPALAAFVGVGDEQVDRADLFQAARIVVEQMAADRPAVLVFEDLHWADASLLDLVQWLAARVRDVPVLIIAIARSELLDRVPDWARGLERYTALGLGPLDDDAVRRFVGALIASTPDVGDIHDQVARTAAGNPLFIEELVSWLVDTRDSASTDVPRTIRAIIAARIDALPPANRRALLDASVIGETFWMGALEALGASRDEVDEALEDLERREIIRRDRTSRLPNDVEFRFRHNLIREVAYETIPHATRRDRHRAVAQYLEEVGVGAGSMGAVLASHWHEAGEPERALHYLVEAADQAARGWAKIEAARLYSEALQLVAEDNAHLRRTIQVKRGLARQAALHAYTDTDQLSGGKSFGEMSPPIS